MGGTIQHHDTNSEQVARIRALLELSDAPLISHYLPEPIRLTQSEKSDLYAIGWGRFGLVVQFRDGAESSEPLTLQSFATHQPYIFDEILPEALTQAKSETATLTKTPKF